MKIYNEQNPRAYRSRSEYFVLPRWWRLVTLHWVENRRRYLLGLLALGGALTAWFSFVLVMDKHSPLNLNYQISAYYIGLFLIGCLWGSLLFSELGHKTQGITYLSLPASHLEKLLCALFFGVVLFFTAYTLLFYVVDIPLVKLANQVILQNFRHGYTNIYSPDHVALYNLFENNGAPIPAPGCNVLLLTFFGFQSAFILGSVYFPRYAFIKTLVCIALFWLICMLFITKVVEGNLPDGWRMKDLFEWSTFNDTTHEQKVVRLPSWVDGSLYFFIKYCVPFLLFGIAYTRLTEKEV